MCPAALADVETDTRLDPITRRCLNGHP